MAIAQRGQMESQTKTRAPKLTTTFSTGKIRDSLVDEDWL
jgi:hypothetical protein